MTVRQLTSPMPRFAMERLLPYLGPGFEPMLQYGLMAYAKTMYRFIASHAHQRRVLDIGCGTGYGTALLNTCSPGHVWGLDQAADIVTFAADYYPALAPRLAAGNALRLPYRDAQFDLVSSIEVIEHVASGADFLREVIRVLRPGGECFISTPNRLIASPGRQRPKHPYHVREYSYDEFRDLLRSLFDVVTITCVYITERVFNVRYMSPTLRWRPPFPLAHIERYCAWRFWPWTHARVGFGDVKMQPEYRPDCFGFLAICSAPCSE